MEWLPRSEEEMAADKVSDYLPQQSPAQAAMQDTINPTITAGVNTPVPAEPNHFI